MRLATLVLPVLLLTTACSVKKNLDEMHDKTVQMAETTDTLGNQTAETKDLLAWVAALQKQGDGFQVRNNAFHNIIESESINKKIESAIAYMYAYEFQLVTFADIKGIDVLQLRQLLAAQAVAEFGKTLPELLPDTSPSKWKLDATKTGNKNESLMAISAVLHRINYYQKEQTALVNIRPVSMLDLLSESLLKAQDINSGRISRDKLTDLDKEVLREQQLFTYMIQLRYKTLPVIALARISHLKDGFLSKLGMLLFKWTPSFDELNLEQINYASDIVDEAVKTRRILEKMGVEAKLDSKIAKIIRKMDTESLRDKLDSTRDEAILQGLERFDASVAELMK